MVPKPVTRQPSGGLNELKRHTTLDHETIYDAAYVADVLSAFPAANSDIIWDDIISLQDGNDIFAGGAGCDKIKGEAGLHLHVIAAAPRRFYHNNRSPA